MAGTHASAKKSLTEFVDERRIVNPIYNLPSVVQNEIVLGRQSGIGPTMIVRWLVHEHDTRATVAQVKAFLTKKGL